jgi:hypothetical protein
MFDLIHLAIMIAVMLNFKNLAVRLSMVPLIHFAVKIAVNLKNFSAN